MIKQFAFLLLLFLPVTYAVTPAHPGDVNNDNSVNFLDINIIVTNLGLAQFDPRADVNNDVVIDIFDLMSVARYWNAAYSTPPPSNLYPHEPASYVPFANSSFDVLPPAKRGPVPGWLGVWLNDPAHPNGKLGTEATAPISAPSVFETIFRPTLAAGTTAADMDGWDAKGITVAGEKQKVYVSLWIKINGSDYENQATGTKMGYVPYAYPPGYKGGGPGFFILQGVGSQAILPAYNMCFFTTVPAPGKNFCPPSAQKLMTVGQWHQFEAILEMNSAPGVADGIVTMWVDGVLTSNDTNAQFLDLTNATNRHGFSDWHWGPVWGGSVGNRTRTDYMFIDQVYLSGLP